MIHYNQWPRAHRENGRWFPAIFWTDNEGRECKIIENYPCRVASSAIKKAREEIERGTYAAGYEPIPETDFMKTTTQTDTPETDAVIASDTGDSGFIRDLAIHARKLERERDAALREVTELRKDKERLEFGFATLLESARARSLKLAQQNQAFGHGAQEIIRIIRQAIDTLTQPQ